jgi:P2-related tail formation protein
MDNILASSISNKEHLSVFDKVADLRNQALEVEKALIYIIDQVDEKALLPLAVQFDVMGIKGWDLCSTADQRRQLIKRAIELHRYKGTPYGVKAGLESAGFRGSQIVERVGSQHNGLVNHNGAIYYEGGNWANFRVIVNLGNDKGISADQTALITALINEYKNVRSQLLDLKWRADLQESMQPTDAFTITAIYSDVNEQFNPGIDHDGTGRYNGQYRHRTYNDSIDLTEITD